MNDFPVLQTPRLLLREIIHADAPDLLSIHADQEAQRFMFCSPMQDLEEAHGWVSRFAQECQGLVPAVRWGIVRRADNAFLGTCGMYDWVQNWHRCSVGYALGRFAWGQGYMSEALTEVLRWMFGPLEIHRVGVEIHGDNTASLRLVQRLGFQVEGTLRQAILWDGQTQDVLQLGLLRPAFASVHPISPATSQG